jgi:hypothetical protein
MATPSIQTERRRKLNPVGLFALALGFYILGFTVFEAPDIFGLASANPALVAGVSIALIASAVVLSIEAMEYFERINSTK